MNDDPLNVLPRGAGAEQQEQQQTGPSVFDDSPRPPSGASPQLSGVFGTVVDQLTGDNFVDDEDSVAGAYARVYDTARVKPSLSAEDKEYINRGRTSPFYTYLGERDAGFQTDGEHPQDTIVPLASDMLGDDRYLINGGDGMTQTQVDRTNAERAAVNAGKIRAPPAVHTEAELQETRADRALRFGSSVLAGLVANTGKSKWSVDKTVGPAFDGFSRFLGAILSGSPMSAASAAFYGGIQNLQAFGNGVDSINAHVQAEFGSASLLGDVAGALRQRKIREQQDRRYQEALKYFADLRRDLNQTMDWTAVSQRMLHPSAELVYGDRAAQLRGAFASQDLSDDDKDRLYDLFQEQGRTYSDDDRDLMARARRAVDPDADDDPDEAQRWFTGTFAPFIGRVRPKVSGWMNMSSEGLARARSIASQRLLDVQMELQAGQTGVLVNPATGESKPYENDPFRRRCLMDRRAMLKDQLAQMDAAAAAYGAQDDSYRRIREQSQRRFQVAQQRAQTTGDQARALKDGQTYAFKVMSGRSGRPDLNTYPGAGVVPSVPRRKLTREMGLIQNGLGSLATNGSDDLTVDGPQYASLFNAVQCQIAEQNYRAQIDILDRCGANGASWGDAARGRCTQEFKAQLDAHPWMNKGQQGAVIQKGDPVDAVDLSQWIQSIPQLKNSMTDAQKRRYGVGSAVSRVDTSEWGLGEGMMVFIGEGGKPRFIGFKTDPFYFGDLPDGYLQHPMHARMLQLEAMSDQDMTDQQRMELNSLHALCLWCLKDRVTDVLKSRFRRRYANGGFGFTEQEVRDGLSAVQGAVMSDLQGSQAGQYANPDGRSITVPAEHIHEQLDDAGSFLEKSPDDATQQAMDAYLYACGALDCLRTGWSQRAAGAAKDLNSYLKMYTEHLMALEVAELMTPEQVAARLGKMDALRDAVKFKSIPALSSKTDLAQWSDGVCGRYALITGFDDDLLPQQFKEVTKDLRKRVQDVLRRYAGSEFGKRCVTATYNDLTGGAQTEVSDAVLTAVSDAVMTGAARLASPQTVQETNSAQKKVVEDGERRKLEEKITKLQQDLEKTTQDLKIRAGNDADLQKKYAKLQKQLEKQQKIQKNLEEKLEKQKKISADRSQSYKQKLEQLKKELSEARSSGKTDDGTIKQLEKKIRAQNAEIQRLQGQEVPKKQQIQAKNTEESVKKPEKTKKPTQEQAQMDRVMKLDAFKYINRDDLQKMVPPDAYLSFDRNHDDIMVPLAYSRSNGRMSTGYSLEFADNLRRFVQSERMVKDFKNSEYYDKLLRMANMTVLCACAQDVPEHKRLLEVISEMPAKDFTGICADQLVSQLTMRKNVRMYRLGNPDQMVRLYGSYQGSTVPQGAVLMNAVSQERDRNYDEYIDLFSHQLGNLGAQNILKQVDGRQLMDSMSDQDKKRLADTLNMGTLIDDKGRNVLEDLGLGSSLIGIENPGFWADKGKLSLTWMGRRVLYRHNREVMVHAMSDALFNPGAVSESVQSVMRRICRTDADVSVAEFLTSPYFFGGTDEGAVPDITIQSLPGGYRFTKLNSDGIARIKARLDSGISTSLPHFSEQDAAGSRAEAERYREDLELLEKHGVTTEQAASGMSMYGRAADILMTQDASLDAVKAAIRDVFGIVQFSGSDGRNVVLPCTCPMDVGRKRPRYSPYIGAVVNASYKTDGMLAFVLKDQLPVLRATTGPGWHDDIKNAFDEYQARLDRFDERCRSPEYMQDMTRVRMHEAMSNLIDSYNSMLGNQYKSEYGLNRDPTYKQVCDFISRYGGDRADGEEEQDVDLRRTGALQSLVNNGIDADIGYDLGPVEQGRHPYVTRFDRVIPESMQQYVRKNFWDYMNMTDVDTFRLEDSDGRQMDVQLPRSVFMKEYGKRGGPMIGDFYFRDPLLLDAAYKFAWYGYHQNLDPVRDGEKIKDLMYSYVDRVLKPQYEEFYGTDWKSSDGGGTVKQVSFNEDGGEQTLEQYMDACRNLLYDFVLGQEIENEKGDLVRYRGQMWEAVNNPRAFMDKHMMPDIYIDQAGTVRYEPSFERFQKMGYKDRDYMNMLPGVGAVFDLLDFQDQTLQKIRERSGSLESDYRSEEQIQAQDKEDKEHVREKIWQLAKINTTDDMRGGGSLSDVPPQVLSAYQFVMSDREYMDAVCDAYLDCMKRGIGDMKTYFNQNDEALKGILGAYRAAWKHVCDANVFGAVTAYLIDGTRKVNEKFSAQGSATVCDDLKLIENSDGKPKDQIIRELISQFRSAQSIVQDARNWPYLHGDVDSAYYNKFGVTRIVTRKRADGGKVQVWETVPSVLPYSDPLMLPPDFEEDRTEEEQINGKVKSERDKVQERVKSFRNRELPPQHVYVDLDPVRSAIRDMASTRFLAAMVRGELVPQSRYSSAGEVKKIITSPYGLAARRENPDMKWIHGQGYVGKDNGSEELVVYSQSTGGPEDQSGLQICRGMTLADIMKRGGGESGDDDGLKVNRFWNKRYGRYGVAYGFPGHGDMDTYYVLIPGDMPCMDKDVRCMGLNTSDEAYTQIRNAQDLLYAHVYDQQNKLQNVVFPVYNGILGKPMILPKVWGVIVTTKKNNAPLKQCSSVPGMEYSCKNVVISFNPDFRFKNGKAVDSKR